MMKQASTPTPYWDYEWDYTMGKLEEQPGFNVDISGTASTTMVTDGEKFVSNSNAYCQVYIPSSGVQGANRYMNNGYGVLEVEFYGKFNKSNGAHNFRITAAQSSSKRVTLCQSGTSLKWRIFDANTPGNGTAIASCSDGNYKVKIVFKDTVADIYINDVLVKANQSTSTTVYGSSNSVMHQNGGGSSYYAKLKSFKIHQGQ